MLRSAVLVGCHDVAFRTGLLCRVVLGVVCNSLEGVGRIVNLSFFVPPVGRFQLRASDVFCLRRT